MLVHEGQRDQGPQRSTIAVAKGHLRAQLAVAGGDQLPDMEPVRLILEQRRERLTDKPSWLTAQQSGQGVIDPDDLALAAQQQLAVE